MRPAFLVLLALLVLLVLLMAVSVLVGFLVGGSGDDVVDGITSGRPLLSA